MTEDLSIFQQVDIPTCRKKQTVVIQNVTVESGMDFDRVVTLVRQYGGVQEFIKALYCWVIQQNRGNLNQAADTLMIPRQTLSEFRKKYLLSDDR